MAGIKGQALTELALFISVPTLVLIWGVPLVWNALNERMQAQQLINTEIELVEYRSGTQSEKLDLEAISEKANWVETGTVHSIERSSDYPFAKLLNPIIQSINTIGSAGFEIDNLVSVSRNVEDEANLSQVKLVNDWSPVRQEQLIARPAALTATYQLKRAGFDQVQSFIGILPFAREFRPDSFRPGFINIDVVPAGSS